MRGSGVAAAAGRRLALVFFLQAAAAGSFLTRIPDIQGALRVNEGVLGLALLGQPLGGLLLLPFASRIVERIGTRLAMLAGLPLLATVVAAVAVAPAPELVFVCLATYGGVFAVTSLAMNVEADRIEAASGVRVMNMCHGLGSLGLLSTALIGAAARGAGVPHALHLAAIVPIVLVATALLVGPMRAANARPHLGQQRRRILVRPTLMTLCLVGVFISAALLEGTSRAWSIIYMRDSFAVPQWIEALSLPAFLATMSIGRLTGDRLTTRFGPVGVGRSFLGIALAGLLVVVAAPSFWVALAGFALVGLGCSVIYPLTLSAAARLGDRPASENVSSVTMVGAIAVLGAPALLGYVATEWGIRMTFAVIVPAVLLSLALARFLDRKGAAAVRE